MIVPNFFSLAASITVLYLFFRKSIPKRYNLEQLVHPKSAIKDKRMFQLSWSILSVLFIGYLGSEFFQIPVSFVVGTVAIIFLFIGNRNSRSEEHTSELQSRGHLVCRLLLEKKK